MACIISLDLGAMLADILPRGDQDNKVGYNSSRCLGISLRHEFASRRRRCGTKS